MRCGRRPTRRSPSPSTAPRARSMRARPPRSPCTRGCASTVTWGPAMSEAPGAGDERSVDEDLEPYEKRHKDGSVWARGQQLEGRMHGYWEFFRVDGTL